MAVDEGMDVGVKVELRLRNCGSFCELPSIAKTFSIANDANTI